jgi:hypothetical protein
MSSRRATTIQTVTTPVRPAADGPAPPLIAVIVPVYKQAHYLPDAVLSVIGQSMRPRVRTVIVDDGCPSPETERAGRYFREAFPGEVFYVRKPNGGVSSARNYAIRFALDAWPGARRTRCKPTGTRWPPPRRGPGGRSPTSSTSAPTRSYGGPACRSASGGSSTRTTATTAA